MLTKWARNGGQVSNKTAVILIANDDPNDNPYQITLTGNLIPEMNIVGVASGGYYNFGNVVVGELSDKTFTIQNLGCGSLVLSGNPRVAISGDKYSQFSITEDPAATISPGNTSSFIVVYEANRTGTFTAMLSITNNDPDENPYVIHLAGTGVSPSGEATDESARETSKLISSRKRNLGKNIHTLKSTKTNFVEGHYNPHINGNTLAKAPSQSESMDIIIELLRAQGYTLGKGPIISEMNIQMAYDLKPGPVDAKHTFSSGRGGDAINKSMSTGSSPRAGSYYIYAYDGRLIAEYDVHGTCVKDYVYIRDRLVAEYDPVSSQYYYYTQDQVRSTQIVTDDSGSVVYAEAHDPYGGIQKTWINAYEPKRKYEDKERDTESELDYFGARYYSYHIYRWLSVDPVVNHSYSDAQLWNLYSFCANNPISVLDPDGSVIRIQGDAAFVAEVCRMLAYLKQSKLGAYIIGVLEDSSTVYTIQQSDKPWAFVPATNTILADPTAGLCIEDGRKTGQVQSAAMGLMHELTHAFQKMRDPVTFADEQMTPEEKIRNKDLRDRKIEGGDPSWEQYYRRKKDKVWYSDWMEYMAIAYERQIASDLHEPIRWSSGGYATPVEVPYHYPKRK